MSLTLLWVNLSKALQDIQYGIAVYMYYKFEYSLYIGKGCLHLQVDDDELGANDEPPIPPARKKVAKFVSHCKCNALRGVIKLVVV